MPSVVKVEVGGWMTLEHCNHSSSSSSGEDEVFQPTLKRKADKPAKSTRPSKVARISEGGGIFSEATRSSPPSRDRKSSVDVRNTSNTHARGGTPQDSLLVTEKGKVNMSGDRSSSGSLLDPSKVVKDIFESPAQGHKERPTGIDVQKENLESALKTDSKPNRGSTSSQAQFERDGIISEVNAQPTSKRPPAKPSELKEVSKAKHSIFIDLTLDDDEIVLPSPRVKSKKGKKRATIVPNSTEGKASGRDLPNFQGKSRQDRGNRSINGDKTRKVSTPEISSKHYTPSTIARSVRSPFSADVIDLCSDSDSTNDLNISALSVSDLNSTSTVVINDAQAPSLGNKDEGVVRKVTPARMVTDSQAIPLSSVIEGHSPPNDAVHLPMTPSSAESKIFQPSEASSSAPMVSITSTSCPPVTGKDIFKLQGSNSLASTDTMDSNTVGEFSGRIKEISIDPIQSDGPRISIAMPTVVSHPIAVQPGDTPSDSKHVRFATSSLNGSQPPEHGDTPMDYVDCLPENPADSMTDTHTSTVHDNAQIVAQSGLKVPGPNQSLDSFAPSSSSSMVTSNHSESSGPSLQFARKSTRVTQIQNPGDDSGSSTSRTPEPEKPVTPSTPSGRRIVAVKEPDYAKLRANISESVPDGDRLSAAIRWPAEKVPTLLHDMINRLPEGYLFNPYMKLIFESMIEENTALDEPTAPPIQIIGIKNGPVTPPWEFYYTNRILYGQGVPRSDKRLLKGCSCIGPCDPKSKTCACVARQMALTGDDKSIKGFLYKKGRLTTPGYPIFECNDACECSEECVNRVIQHGRKHSISIMLTKKKGWGVFADEKISRGTYLGIYAGEMILEQEADERGKLYDKYGRTYLFDMDFYFLQGLRGERGASSSPSKKEDFKGFNTYTIDAFHVGNFTRFLNHSCDPNCQIIASYVNEPDLNKPTLTIFTSRDIHQGEELTFAYFGGNSEEEEEEEEVDKHGQKKVKVVEGPSSHKKKAVHKPCLCGAANCRGEMF